MDLVTSFEVVLRGYDRVAVDALVRAVESAAGDEDRIAAAIKSAGSIPVVLRGYDRAQVDAWLAGHGAGSEPEIAEFEVMLRGYGRAETDALLTTVEAAMDSTDPALRREALRAISAAQLPVVWRGYNRRQVDGWLEMLADVLREP
jgi:cell division septum initiation protein DivIVA